MTIYVLQPHRVFLDLINHLNTEAIETKKNIIHFKFNVTSMMQCVNIIKSNKNALMRVFIKKNIII